MSIIKKNALHATHYFKNNVILYNGTEQKVKHYYIGIIITGNRNIMLIYFFTGFCLLSLDGSSRDSCRNYVVLFHSLRVSLNLIKIKFYCNDQTPCQEISCRN